MILTVFKNIKIYRSVYFVCQSGFNNFFDELLLFDYMSRGPRFYRWRQYVELIHVPVVGVHVFLYNFHGFEVLKARLLLYLVLPLVGIVLEVAHIGYVAHVAHIVAQMHQITVEQVEGYGGAGMTQVCIAVNGRTAYIQSGEGRMKRLEGFLSAREAVVDRKIILHASLVLQNKSKGKNSSGKDLDDEAGRISCICQNWLIILRLRIKYQGSEFISSDTLQFHHAAHAYVHEKYLHLMQLLNTFTGNNEKKYRRSYKATNTDPRWCDGYDDPEAQARRIRFPR